MKKLLLMGLICGLSVACSSSDNGTNGTIPKHNTPRLTDPNLPRLPDGTKVNPSEINRGVFTKTTGRGVLRGINLPYSVTGYWTDDYAKPKKDILAESFRTSMDIVFYQKIPSRIDESSKAVLKYDGVSLGAGSRGKMTLDIDLGNRTSQGKLYDRTTINGGKLNDINLHKGEVLFKYRDGETFFTGKASSKDFEGVYAGGFAGPNAQEAFGMVSDLNSDVTEIFAGEKK